MSGKIAWRVEIYNILIRGTRRESDAAAGQGLNTASGPTAVRARDNAAVEEAQQVFKVDVLYLDTTPHAVGASGKFSLLDSCVLHGHTKPQ